jgi:hypothetical protein
MSLKTVTAGVTSVIGGQNFAFFEKFDVFLFKLNVLKAGKLCKRHYPG